MSQRVERKSKKLKKSQKEWQNKLAEMEKGLWFKQSSLSACNQQPLRDAAAASSSHYKLEIKLFTSGIEPWSFM